MNKYGHTKTIVCKIQCRDRFQSYIVRQWEIFASKVSTYDKLWNEVTAVIKSTYEAMFSRRKSRLAFQYKKKYANEEDRGRELKLASE
jgi:hypothetical protein